MCGCNHLTGYLCESHRKKKQAEPTPEPEVRPYTIRICDACMRLEGEMCDEPECVFIRCTMSEAKALQESLTLRHDESGYVAPADELCPDCATIRAELKKVDGFYQDLWNNHYLPLHGYIRPDIESVMDHAGEDWPRMTREMEEGVDTLRAENERLTARLEAADGLIETIRYAIQNHDLASEESDRIAFRAEYLPDEPDEATETGREE